MTIERERALKRFEREIPRINAHFGNRFFVSVVKTADCADGDHYAGLIRTREGFLRLALDEANNALVLFASKVADNLKGYRSGPNDAIRPTDALIQKSYCIAARRLRSGPLLPPDTAGFFIDRINAYSMRVSRDSSDKFTLYAVRIDDTEIYANKYVAYLIDRDSRDRYSVRVVIPARRADASHIPGAASPRWANPLFQKTIARHVDRAEAHHCFALHSQALSSRLWDHKDIYRGEGGRLRMGRFLSDLIHYPASHMLEMTSTALVAGGFTYFHDPRLGAALASLAGAHAVLDIGFKASVTRALAKLSNRRHANRFTALDAYDPDADCSYHYLIKTAENIRKPWHHVDPARCNIDNLRFLTFAEMQPIVGKIRQPPETMLQPASLRGLAMFGSQRGFTTRVCFPAPKSRIEISQGGLVVLKRAISPIVTEMFVTYRPDACVSENTRLPENYVDQALGGDGIQHIIHCKEPTPERPRFTDRQIGFADMRERLTDLFNDTEPMLDNFIAPIAPQFREESYRYIHELFAPDVMARQDGLFMGGNNPLLPSIRSIL
jgi:hypothetical protein